MKKRLFYLNASLPASIAKSFNLVKLADNQIIFPFREAKLVASVTGRWYIKFYVWNVQKNDLERVRTYVPAEYKTDVEKKAYAKREIQKINRWLHDGLHRDLNKLDNKKNPTKSRNPIDNATTEIHNPQQAFDFVINNCLGSLRKKSIQNYKGIANEFAKYLKDNKKYVHPRSITTQMIREFFTYKQTTDKISNSTYNGRMGNLKSVFTHLVDHGIIEKNPVIGIKEKSVTKQRNYPFQEKQRKELIKYVLKHDRDLYYFTQFVFWAYVRPGELVQLKIKHIYFDTAQIHIPPEISKNKKSAFIEIEPELMQIINEMNIQGRPPEYYIFGKDLTAGPISTHANRASDRHRKILKELSLGFEYVLYSWKHTGARHAVNERKQNIMYVKEQIRHASLEETYIYLKSIGCKV